jgi:hypothetical protein
MGAVVITIPSPQVKKIFSLLSAFFDHLTPIKGLLYEQALFSVLSITEKSVPLQQK